MLKFLSQHKQCLSSITHQINAGKLGYMSKINGFQHEIMLKIHGFFLNSLYITLNSLSNSNDEFVGFASEYKEVVNDWKVKTAD